MSLNAPRALRVVLDPATEDDRIAARAVEGGAIPDRVVRAWQRASPGNDEAPRKAISRILSRILGKEYVLPAMRLLERRRNNYAYSVVDVALVDRGLALEGEAASILWEFVASEDEL